MFNLNDFWTGVQPYILPFLSVIGGVWVARIAKRGNERATQIETEAAPYSEVTKRVTVLEKVNRALMKLINLHEERESDLEREVEKAGGVIPPRDHRFEQYEKDAFG